MTDLCPVCGSVRNFVFSAQVLNRREAFYFQCGNCGLLQARDPDWLEEAYSAAIARTDTGLVQRNLAVSSKLAPLLYWWFGKQGTYVDYAGGYGLLVRLMRDIGFDFFWQDRYCANLLAPGFEAGAALTDISAVTAIEVMEHIADPCSFVQEVIGRSNKGTLIFTTLTYSGPAAPARDWWYYSFPSGQHISFYREETLRRIASRLGLQFRSSGGVHVFSRDSRLASAPLPMLTGRLSGLLTRYVRRKMRSKIMQDHEVMLKAATRKVEQKRSCRE